MVIQTLNLQSILEQLASRCVLPQGVRASLETTLKYYGQPENRGEFWYAMTNIVTRKQGLGFIPNYIRMEVKSYKLVEIQANWYLLHQAKSLSGVNIGNLGFKRTMEKQQFIRTGGFQNQPSPLQTSLYLSKAMISAQCLSAEKENCEERSFVNI